MSAFFFGKRSAAKRLGARLFLTSSVLAFLAIPLFGQQGTLSLSSASTSPGSSAALTVSTSANGGIHPAVLRWTMQYPADVTSVNVIPGAAATDAGKTVTCSYAVSVATCVAWGDSAMLIEDGTLATATFQISPASKSSVIPIVNGAASASDGDGNLLPITGSNGTIGLLLPPAIGCAPAVAPRLLNQYFSAQCFASGGAPPYHWQVSSGALPTGLSLTSQGTSALITGTPTVAGVYRYTISVTDTGSPVPASGTLAFATTVQSSASFNVLGSLPDLIANQNWTTTFTVVNTSAGDAQSQLNFLGDTGNLLSLPVLLPQQPINQSVQSAPSFNWTLGANASLIVQTASLANLPTQTGSAQLAGTASMGGFAIFHLYPTEQEAVVPLETRNASSYVLAFDNTSDAVLSVALANVSSKPASVPVLLRDDTGAQIGSTTLALLGSGHMSFVLSDLFPVASGQRGTAEFDTPAGGQISVLGVRNAPPGTITTIPALVSGAAGGGNIAHIASANGWTTTFALINTSATAAPAHLQFFDDNGNPLILPLSFPQSGDSASTVDSKVDTTLDAGATLLIETTGSLDSPLQSGSAQLTSTGSVSGFGIFRYEPNGQEALVPLENRNASTYVLAFDNTGGITTGVALSTNSSVPVNIPVIIRDDSGAQVGTSAIPLAANGHGAFVLATQFPATAKIRGTLEFVTPSGAQLSVVGIRTPPSHTFTTLPTIAK